MGISIKSLVWLLLQLISQVSSITHLYIIIIVYIDIILRHHHARQLLSILLYDIRGILRCHVATCSFNENRGVCINIAF